MNSITKKIILISASLFFIPILVSADQILPPEMPVLFYGQVEINDEPAAINIVISVKTKADNIEIASSTIKNIGRYFIEVPCKNYIGQAILFNIGSMISGQSECADVKTIPSINLNLVVDITNITADQWTTEVVIPNSVSDDAEVKLNFTPVSSDNKKIVTIGDNGLVLTRDSSLAENRFEVNFLANTTISGNNDWDGTMIMPVIRDNNLVSVSSGEVEKIIEIGFNENVLTLNKPASILFPQMSGKKIGYSYNNSDFTGIVNVCPLNNGDSLVGERQDCKFDDGVNLIVWTKHFTKFVLYSQLATPTSGGSVPVWLLENIATGFAPAEVEKDVIVLGLGFDYRTIQLEKIVDDAIYINAGNANLFVDKLGLKRDNKMEIADYNKYVVPLIKGVNGLEQTNIYALTNFIVYGSETTKILGTGERAGVLNSYKSAFGKLPTNQSEWEDVIKIANNRWPSEKSEEAEVRAEEKFKEVYLRETDMNNSNDNAAVTIIAYGLRPDSRNLDSEKAGILTFKHIFSYNPTSATDWDIVRAIAYSGAIR